MRLGGFLSSGETSKQEISAGQFASHWCLGETFEILKRSMCSSSFLFCISDKSEQSLRHFEIYFETREIIYVRFASFFPSVETSEKLET